MWRRKKDSLYGIQNLNVSNSREVKVVGKVKDCVVQLARTLEKKILMSIQVVEIPDSYAPWLVLLNATHATRRNKRCVLIQQHQP